ncbi:MAG: arginine--tRNA ligase [Ardenticatenales bacterium]|nr:arginine--tRNA ligase [Ardenticatenales bacterium]
MPRVQHDLAQMTHQAIRKAQKKKDLPRFDIPEIVIERPKSTEWGDYSTAVCLAAARLAAMAPLDIAKQVVKRFPKTARLDDLSISAPGFINFSLADSWLQSQVEEILAQGETYADINLGEGKRVQVEFGSANPTGPLHVGFGRNVVLGDGIANVLAAAGYQVQREYYVNDAGTQMDLFAESLFARYAQALGDDTPLPEGGYQGEYVTRWGKAIAQRHADKLLGMPRRQALEQIKQIGLEEHALGSVRADCEALGISYDEWFHETTLYQEGQFQEIMSLLRQRDMLEEREGAVWFTASKHDERLKDEVIIRSNGQPGYFASDIAYHYNKFIERGFDWVIDVWGADHQGHVPRMKAMMKALGLDPDRLTLILYQLVAIKKGGADIRLSKRAGTLVELRELINDVGGDAVRFVLLSRAADSQMVFDVDLAREQSDSNPVYYVQYAHARIASILREAAKREFSAKNGDVSLLTHPAELALIRKMVDLSAVIEKAATNLAPHHLTHYAQELANVFTLFYRDCRVLPRKSGDPGATAEETAARLKLVRAARIILARAIHLMGMSAPDRM